MKNIPEKERIALHFFRYVIPFITYSYLWVSIYLDL